MNAADTLFLQRFFRALEDEPLDPDDKRYVSLYDDPELVPADPVRRLARGIEWAPSQSVHTFTGLRGTGKSTELRRLKRDLEGAGCLVLLTDMAEFLNLNAPLDVADFLLALGGALSKALEGKAVLGKDPSRPGYWERFAQFLLRTKVDLSEFGIELGTEGVAASMKLSLKQDESFKERLRERMKGHIGALVADLHGFVETSVAQVREKKGDKGLKVVLILDSIEQLRGTHANGSAVYSSAETVFVGHAEKLRLPYLHVVYTVPPWLKIRAPGLGVEFNGHQSIPSVKVRDRAGKPFQAALDKMERLVRQRGDWTRLLDARGALDRLCLVSGGYLRDLFRLLRSCLMQADERGVLPLQDAHLDRAVSELRNSYLPIAGSDAVWLARVADSHRAELPGSTDLGDLSRLFDNNLLLSYRNDDEWFDVHPAVLDAVREVAGEAPSGAPKISTAPSAG